MITLVIPDIHNRWHWVEEFLGKTPHDEAVFLGDYFDNFRDGPKEAEETARWLKESLKKENRKHLLGNHDAHYWFPKLRKIRSEGFSEEKLAAIQSILTEEDWNKILPVYKTQGWWLSHAGVPDFVTQYEAALKTDIKYAKQGYTRKGLTWTLWRRWRSFNPIRHVHQIVGHSPSTVIRECIAIGDEREKDLKKPEFYQIEDGTPPLVFSIRADIPLYTASQNWCIDTHNRHIGIIENGAFRTIENPIELPPEPEPPPEVVERWRQRQALQFAQLYQTK